MLFPLTVSLSLIWKKKSLGAIQAILCLFLVLLLVSMSNAAEVTQITLAWDRSNDSDVTGYKVYWRTAGRAYGKPIGTVGNVSNPEFSLTLSYGEKYYFAVTAHDRYGNESFRSDEISWPIQVFSPNGGEIIATGDTYPIEWYADSEAVKFRLLYSTNKGKSWIDINEDDYVTSGSYNWKVPAPRGNKKTYLVRVIGYDASNRKVGEDRSDAPFGAEVVRLAAPDGGEQLTSGVPYNITWVTNETVRPVEEVRLFFTEDGGATWDPIDILTGNPESYGWTVPAVAKKKKKCGVKVVLKDVEGVTVGSDVSDDYFTINP